VRDPFEQSEQKRAQFARACNSAQEKHKQMCLANAKQLEELKLACIARDRAAGENKILLATFDSALRFPAYRLFLNVDFFCRTSEGFSNEKQRTNIIQHIFFSECVTCSIQRVLREIELNCFEVCTS
jgi:hypothetical protein